MAKRKKKELEPTPAITEQSPPTETIHSATTNGELAATTVDAVSWSEASEPVAEQPIAAERAVVSEPPANENTRKSSFPDPNKPFSIAHNNHAGVRLLKFDRFKQTQLAFREQVSEAMHAQLTEAGYRYRPEEDVYTRQYGNQGEPLAIVEAKRLYDQVVEQVLAETGARRQRGR